MPTLREECQSYFGQNVIAEISDEEQKLQVLKNKYRDMSKSPVGGSIFKDLSEFCGEDKDLFETCSMQDLGWSKQEINLYLQGRLSVILRIREMIGDE